MLEKIITPTLLIDKEKVRKNIRKIFDKSVKHGFTLRPHFKTHQSKEIAKLFSEIGVTRATVSSLEMADYFASNGWKDLTIAFPINIREIDLLNKLAKKNTINILVENIQSIEFLNKKLKHKLNAFIKINVNYNRAGVEADDFKKIADLVLALEKSEKIYLKGILTHAGHSYHAKSVDEIKEIHYSQLKKMANIKKSLGDRYADLIVSIGDTPTVSLMDDFPGVDEVRAGNFVFYDVTQLLLTTCNVNEIAVAVAAPVVAKHQSRNEIVVFCGGVHLSKEYVNSEYGVIYGLPVFLNEKNWSAPIENSFVKSLSQEHGIIRLNSEAFGKIEVGDLIGVLPVHSCLSANLLRNKQQLI